MAHLQLYLYLSLHAVDSSGATAMLSMCSLSLSPDHWLTALHIKKCEYSEAWQQDYPAGQLPTTRGS